MELKRELNSYSSTSFLCYLQHPFEGFKTPSSSLLIPPPPVKARVTAEMMMMLIVDMEERKKLMVENGKKEKLGCSIFFGFSGLETEDKEEEERGGVKKCELGS